jgi:hypothetical protein
MDAEIRQEVPEKNIVSKEELLGALPSVEAVQYPSPTGSGSIMLKGIVGHIELMQLMHTIERRIKNRIPATLNIPDETLEAASWLEACIEEPKLDFDEALSLAQRAGFWTVQASLKIQQLSGVTPQVMMQFVEDFKENPFVDSTSLLALKDSVATQTGSQPEQPSEK